MKYKNFYLMFTAEKHRNGCDRDASFYVPVNFCWTEEGINDFHIQFEGPGADNYNVPVDPSTGRLLIYQYVDQTKRWVECVPCTTMHIVRDIHKGLKPKPELLDVKLLKKHWPSPNQP